LTLICLGMTSISRGTKHESSRTCALRRTFDLTGVVNGTPHVVLLVSDLESNCERPLIVERSVHPMPIVPTATSGSL
jgi:hypothetical protein